jgi:hypothetical protein
VKWMSFILDNMPRLRKQLRPTVAAFLGFVTGGVGLGIYLHSLFDVLAAALLNIVLLKEFGFELVIAVWCCCGIYGFVRVLGSNRQLTALAATAVVAGAPPPPSTVPPAPPTSGAAADPSSTTPSVAEIAQPWSGKSAASPPPISPELGPSTPPGRTWLTPVTASSAQLASADTGAGTGAMFWHDLSEEQDGRRALRASDPR